MEEKNTLEQQISKINFHLENGDTDLFEDPGYQTKIMSVANQAIAQNHLDGEYLLSVVATLRGNLSTAAENRLKAAMKGNSNAIMEYTNAVGHENQPFQGEELLAAAAASNCFCVETCGRFEL